MTRRLYTAMLDDGFSVNEIACAYALPPTFIRDELRREGRAILRIGTPGTIWDMDESGRRQAIIKRAAKAARAARRAK